MARNTTTTIMIQIHSLCKHENVLSATHWVNILRIDAYLLIIFVLVNNFVPLSWLGSLHCEFPIVTRVVDTFVRFDGGRDFLVNRTELFRRPTQGNHAIGNADRTGRSRCWWRAGGRRWRCGWGSRTAARRRHGIGFERKSLFFGRRAILREKKVVAIANLKKTKTIMSVRNNELVPESWVKALCAGFVMFVNGFVFSLWTLLKWISQENTFTRFTFLTTPLILNGWGTVGGLGAGRAIASGAVKILGLYGWTSGLKLKM